MKKHTLVFGLTGDPVHIGHVRAAEEIHEAFGLEKIIFIPARVPPHQRWAIGLRKPGLPSPRQIIVECLCVDFIAARYLEFHDPVASHRKLTTLAAVDALIPGIVEWVVGSIRRDCLDHVIVLNARHLRRILRAYLAYYHSSRTHLSLNKDPPDTRRMNCGSEIVYRYPPDIIYRRDKATN